MDLLELQKRANILVEKVNTYEANLTEENINEEEILAQQKFADIYSMRPVLKLLFGDSLESKMDRILNNNISLPVYASTAPMWNTKFDLLNSTVAVTKDKHEFMNNIDMINNHNMIQLDVTQNSLSYNNPTFSDREMRIKQGINFSYSSNIRDAVATETQLANVFKWHTENNNEVKNNTVTIYRQVPGVVVYYVGQGGYDWKCTPTISHSTGSTLNEITFDYPFFNGNAYLKTPINLKQKYNHYIYSQEVTDYERYDETFSRQMALKMFIPGTHYTLGKLESPQQIYIPYVEPPQYDNYGNNHSTYNYQAQALYHELVFKNRRKGASENEFDFIPTPESVADNDPQGLAIRTALAKNKKYYINRPFFNELEPESEFDTSKLADLIIENSRHIENYYTLNSIVTNTNESSFNKQTGVMTGIFNQDAQFIKPTHVTTSGNDIDSTNPPTKYIMLSFIIRADWLNLPTSMSPTSSNIMFNMRGNSSGVYNAVVRKYSDTQTQFGWATASGSCIIDNIDLTDDNYEIILTPETFGTRVNCGIWKLNKQTKEVTYLNSFYQSVSSSNYEINISLFNSNFEYDFKPRGIDYQFPMNVGPRDCQGDIGTLHEFDSTNNIDIYTPLLDVHSIDREMTDSEFYNDYKLDYETYAKAFDQPL